MKKTIALFATLTFATAVFAQEGDGTESAQEETAAVVEETAYEPPQEEAKAEEPKKEEKKAPVAVGSKEDRPIGVRAGLNINGVGGGLSSAFGFTLGSYYDIMRIFEMELFGDGFQFRLLLEPGAFVSSRAGILGSTQYWLEVPVTIAATVSIFGGLRVKLAAGPYVGFGVGSFSKKYNEGQPGEYELSQSHFDVGQWYTIGFEQQGFKDWWFDITMAGFGFIDAVSKYPDGNKSKYSGYTPYAFKFILGYNF